jgi:hypothetical protein
MLFRRVYMHKQNVLSPLIEFIQNTMPNILMGMRLVEKIEVFPEATEEEKELQWIVTISSKDSDLIKNKKDFKKWIFLKGVEEIYQSIRKSLENLLIYKTMNLERNPTSHTYPQLLEKIEKETKKNFSRKLELESIIKFRNAVIHNHGIVAKNHCNSEEKNKLIIYMVKR